MESRIEPELDRLDRHVRRGCLRISDKTSRYRVAGAVEEALRLVNLPGEEEGRIYSFRRVSVTGIAPQANRITWRDRFQEVLGALAAQAVHGNDPRASSANAVYFNSYQEAFATLLRHAMRSQARQWFSSSILGKAVPETDHAAQIMTILERLRQAPYFPGPAAAIIFEAVDSADPTPLLLAIPSVTVRTWVRELDSRENLFADPPGIQLPGRVRAALRRAASHFGWRDPHTIWLASLAVIFVSPAAFTSSTAVRRARAALRHLEAAEPRADRAGPPPGSYNRSLVFDDDQAAGGGTTQASAASPRGRRTDLPPRSLTSLEKISVDRGDLNEPADSGSSRTTVERAVFPDRVLDPSAKRIPLAPPRAPETLSGDAASSSLVGEPTAGAGLYFLLQALRRLGIAAALNSCPALVEAGFVDHILKGLAAHAGVGPGDPILLCLHPEQTEFSLPSAVLTALTPDANVWPPNIPRPRSIAVEDRLLLRAWTLAARRWCWRMAKITVREIVNRKGRVWLTRSDLDVTLPLVTADVRIRLAGLDIDPGWLPWFGELGRVVRFHYRDREHGGSAC